MHPSKWETLRPLQANIRFWRPVWANCRGVNWKGHEYTYHNLHQITSPYFYKQIPRRSYWGHSAEQRTTGVQWSQSGTWGWSHTVIRKYTSLSSHAGSFLFNIDITSFRAPPFTESIILFWWLFFYEILRVALPINYNKPYDALSRVKDSTQLL